MIFHEFPIQTSIHRVLPSIFSTLLYVFSQFMDDFPAEEPAFSVDFFQASPGPGRDTQTSLGLGRPVIQLLG
jgi:hypothetical protein